MKKIRATIVAEMDVDLENYPKGATKEQIIEIESENCQEWFMDYIVSEKIEIVE